MRKLIKKFIYWIMRDDKDADEPRVLATVSARGGRHNEILKPNGLQFTVYAAEGGNTVIETSMYIRKEDDYQHKLFVVTEGEDFGKQIGEIITMERLRRWD